MCVQFRFNMEICKVTNFSHRNEAELSGKPTSGVYFIGQSLCRALWLETPQNWAQEAGWSLIFFEI